MKIEISLGKWKESMLSKTVKQWGRTRFLLSFNYSYTLYFLVKILLVKSKPWLVQHAQILIMVQQCSNQICEGCKDVVIYQNF